MTMNLNNHTVETLAAKVAELEGLVKSMEELVRGKVLLCRKEVMSRYRIGKTTLHRWLNEGILPRPERMGGPRWPLSALESAEKAGRLPRPS